VRLVGWTTKSILAGLCLLSLSCDHVTGPALSAEVVEETLVPSVDQGAGAASTPPADPNKVCCCRIEGSVRNTSSIPVNVSLRWKATNKDGGAIGTALSYVENIPVGEQKPFAAAGIFQSCSRVSHLERTQFVIGIFQP
jgi:hypothetical protein